MKTKYPANCALLSGLTLLALLVFAAPRATAIDIVISGGPTETGSGPNLKARFSNVATVGGIDIDLYGEVLSQTSNKTNKFRADGEDNFKFQIQDGEPGETRSATVRWTFFESGTTTPVSVEELALTIDDLDDYAGRKESIATDDAYSYTVNDPTNVVVSFSNGTLSATGGAQQDAGDPESAVKFLLESGSSFVITYTAEFYWDGNAGFVHDGDGDFVFSNPETRLFYTYYFTNNEDHAIPAGFSDTLPAGLTWDAEFSAILSGNVTGTNILYQDGDTTARVVGMVLHPGSGSVTLCTMGTTTPGVIYNEATVEPDEPGADSLTASATVVLP